MSWQRYSRPRSSQADCDAYWTRPSRPQSAHFQEHIGLSTFCYSAITQQHVIVKRVCWNILYLLYIIVPIKCSCFASVVYTTRVFAGERSVLYTKHSIVALETYCWNYVYILYITVPIKCSCVALAAYTIDGHLQRSEARLDWQYDWNESNIKYNIIN